MGRARPGVAVGAGKDHRVAESAALVHGGDTGADVGGNRYAFDQIAVGSRVGDGALDVQRPATDAGIARVVEVKVHAVRGHRVGDSTAEEKPPVVAAANAEVNIAAISLVQDHRHIDGQVRIVLLPVNRCGSVRGTRRVEMDLAAAAIIEGGRFSAAIGPLQDVIRIHVTGDIHRQQAVDIIEVEDCGVGGSRGGGHPGGEITGGIRGPIRIRTPNTGRETEVRGGFVGIPIMRRRLRGLRGEKHGDGAGEDADAWVAAGGVVAGLR